MGLVSTSSTSERSFVSRLWTTFSSDGFGGYSNTHSALFVHVLFLGGIVGGAVCVSRGDTGQALAFAAVGAVGAVLTALFWRRALVVWRSTRWLSDRDVDA
jgi:hypothetical protein